MFELDQRAKIRLVTQEICVCIRSHLIFKAFGPFALQQFTVLTVRRRIAEVWQSGITMRARPDETRPPDPKSDSDVEMETASKGDPNDPTWRFTKRDPRS